MNVYNGVECIYNFIQMQVSIFMITFDCECLEITFNCEYLVITFEYKCLLVSHVLMSSRSI